MPRLLVHTVALFLIALGSVPACAAGQDVATVTGVARGTDGRPIPGVFVLALRNAEAVLDPVAGALTDSAGRFVLRGLPSEPLVLRVRRLGWTLSAPVAVTPAPGTTVRDLVVESRPLDLTPVRVVAAGACVSRERLADAPAIAAVWAAASDAMRINQEIAKSYAISRVAERTVRRGDEAPAVSLDTILPEVPTATRAAPTPDDELFGTVRRVGLRRRNSVEFRVRGPGILTDEAFLRHYCVGNALETADANLVALTFGPQRHDPARVEATGRILFDVGTGRFVGAEYEYRHEGNVVGRTSMRIGDVDIDGTTVPMIISNDIQFLLPSSGEPYFRESVVFRESRYSRWPASLLK